MADCLGDPRGDSSRLDLLGVAQLVGYGESFPALAKFLGMDEVNLDGADHTVVGVDPKVRGNEWCEGLEMDVSQAGLRAAGMFSLGHE